MMTMTMVLMTVAAGCNGEGVGGCGVSGDISN